MTIQQKRHVVILFAVALILMVPLIAMQFTNEVNWDVFDFIIAGGLLLGTCFLGEYLIRKIKNLQHRAAVIILLKAAFILIWVELAVGLFGSPIAGN